MTPIDGLHHVTAIASDPQRNVNFYAGVLGLRLVKRTVNFDDPGTYHFYFGSEAGSPGTLITFFPWPTAARGATGAGYATACAFGVPSASLEFWSERLARSGVVTSRALRFGEDTLDFLDPDGLHLRIVASGEAFGPAWSGGGVPREHAIRGLHSVAVAEEGYERTARLLTEQLGLSLLGQEDNCFRYAAAGDGLARCIDIFSTPDARRGQLGAGVIHHVAWRLPDDAAQRDQRRRLVELGLNVSPILDRQYFRSIYFREPGGVLFEMATDGPGFDVDEPRDHLGESLKLPPQHELIREKIEQVLPVIEWPKDTGGAS